MPDTFETIRYTADTVLLTPNRRAGSLPFDVLLIERGWAPFEGAWALPGGHVDVGETSRAAAARELAEETGVDVDPSILRQLGVYDGPDRDPRGRYVTVAYVAIVDRAVPTAGDDARAARWWPLNNLPQLAFDHADILADLSATTHP
ncbi:NUDIX hydrolase [Streptomyces sp. ID05-04B]|uniref:NUDIX hydrolase n=1 Tax=Streptomyces sp. ID05-04B TaxID=3028661 RepID=UPI0029C225B7|nr:NUDIX hydrolase [Streptomyces sp. ID05-04B]MDX5569537.1 NUDIX hydrolase [Streptomyces sp. ID05-04B]